MPIKTKKIQMNIWDHSRLSVRKFGGIEEDYIHIHKFIDSSKLFYYNFKHRLLLHNLYGVEIVTQKFGNIIANTDNVIILIRDIAIEHLKEDLNGYVPTLNEWLIENDKELSKAISLPIIDNDEVREFVMKPMLMSNLKSSLLITLSDFGLYLCNELLGCEKSLLLKEYIKKESTVKLYLNRFKITQKWQFRPDKKELNWLKENKNDYKRTTTKKSSF